MKLISDNCPLCGRSLNRYGLCKSCEELINKNPNYYYDISGLTDLLVCATYSGLMRKLILDFKFKGKLSYKDIIGDIMIEKLLCKNLSNEVITYVPMHKRREDERGFNQSKILAEYIANKLDLKFMDIFEKNRDTLFQVGLSKKEREKNLKDAFKVINKADEIIIIDDVITTGTTISELVKASKKNGIKKVTALIAATEIA